MTNDELKDALLSRSPVILTPTNSRAAEYSRVTAIIYRERNGAVVVSAEVLDTNGRSVVICDPKNLTVKGEANV